VLGRDGDRAAVIARYRDGHLRVRADLLARLGELRGKALGCWCAPEPCHADVLIGELERRGASRQDRRRQTSLGLGDDAMPVTSTRVGSIRSKPNVGLVALCQKSAGS